MNYLEYQMLVMLLFKSCCSFKFSFDAIAEAPILLKEGKQQLDILLENAKAPQFGTCWSNIFSTLEVRCRELTEELQSALALRLTDCFLQMSGQGPIACDLPRKECLQKLSDREFNAYTEFYTHTQNICYYLQSKLWHDRSEQTIDRLSTTSFKVSLQLAEAEKGQEALLQHQRESLNLQEVMARQLEASKDTMSNMVEELRISTLEQQQTVASIFQQLTHFQNWAIGEVSWLDSIFFYSSSAIISCLFTSVTRTKRARLPILVVVTLNYLLERYWGGSMSDDSLINASASFQSWVWFSRKVTVSFCVLILIIVAFTYWDYNAINHQMLLQIKKQNSDIIKMLTALDGLNTVSSINENKNVSVSQKRSILNALHKVEKIWDPEVTKVLCQGTNESQITSPEKVNLNSLSKSPPQARLNHSQDDGNYQHTRHCNLEYEKSLPKTDKQPLRRSSRLQRA